MNTAGQIRFLFISFITVILLAACARENSFEGNAIPPRPDTTQGGGGGGGGTTPPPGICKLCVGNDIQAENKWSLHAGSILYCGKIDTVIVLGDRAVFTFFGPSSCSTDSGMVVTVYMDGLRLDHDITSSTVNRVSFFYYDHVAPSYMLQSQANIPFSLTIDEYNHTTRMMRGTFRGVAFTTGGISVPVTDGKFMARAK